MAIQAHIHQQNLGLPISSQDYFFNNNLINNNTPTTNNNNMSNNNNLFYNDLSCNNLQVQYQQQQQYMAHLQNMQRRNSCMENSFGFLQPTKKQKLETNITTTTASTTTSESDYLSQNLSLQIEKQRNEIDRFVILQNERLKVALLEQRKQQLGAIIRRLEAKALQLLKQKDDEILQANKKTMELQEIIRKMEVENQEWQKIALENESIVFSLNNTLEQLKQQQEVCSSSSSNGVDDNKSCCKFIDNKKNIRGKEETFGDFVEETGENRGVFGFNDGKRATKREELCKVCNSRNASVLLLPCRHLCCCKVCDGFIDACPLCKSPKKASIETLIS